MDENENIPYQIDFPIGKMVSNRWKVTSRIGTGAYGVVYCVHDEKKPGNVAALKVELNEVENSVLKIEREVLDKMQDRRHTIRLFGSGKRADYSYIVITLCGADLSRLKQEKKITKFSESTTYRIGIHALYAIKQLQEVGYIHRDVKPQNFVVGGTEKDSRILYLIDFGMVRMYAVPDEQKDENGKPIKIEGPKRWIIRKARRKILLRGTMRYCSLNVHKRNEQGRADDIISLIYMLLEMRFTLPWASAQREERLIALKEGFPTDTNLNKCEGMRDILQYLHNLKYSERPDYKFIYNCLMDVIKKRKWKFSEPYDWEEQPPKKNEESVKKKKESKKSNAQLPTITVSGEHLLPPTPPNAPDPSTPSTTTTDSNYSNKSDGKQGADTPPTSSPSKPSQQQQLPDALPLLEESTAREDSLKYAKEPSEKKKKGSKRKKNNDDEAAHPPAITVPPLTSPNASSKKKKDPVNPGDGSQKKKKASSLKVHNNNNNKGESPQPNHQTSGRPAEKSLYIEYSKCKKDKSECKDVILGEEDLYPTTAPAAFDFKPGDIPSGSSVQTKDQENKFNSTRSDVKNMKSVMSNYAPL